MSDIIYGPTTSGKNYVALSYHQRTAKRNPHKSRWVITGPRQYDVFMFSDDNQILLKNINCYIGITQNCSTKLGVSGELLAKFIGPSGNSSIWHGYPILSKDIDFTEEFLNFLEEDLHIINRLTRLRLAKCKI